MSASVVGALVALVVGAAPPERAPPSNVCLVALDEVQGAEVEVILDALAIEAQKRGLDVVVGPPETLGACDVTVRLAARAEIATRTSLRVLALAGLEPLDRASEIARAVGAALEAEPPAGDVFGGDLPPFEPEAEPDPDPEPAPEPAPDPEPDRALRVSLGGAVMAPVDGGAAYGRVDTSVALELGAPWLIACIGMHTTTPAITRDGRGVAQRVELGGHATLGLAWTPSPIVASLDVGLALAARWSSASAAADGDLPGVSARHTEAVSGVVARAALGWEVTPTFGLGVELLAERYLAGTTLVASGTRLEAPRWTVGGGLRLGVRL